MYICKYFAPYELVPKDVYEMYGDKVYTFFDENALRILDMIRELAGVGLIVNNWFWGGSRTLSGFRPRYCPVGASKSAHKLGKAFDIISLKITTPELWSLIEKNAGKLPCKIRIERTNGDKTVSWLHFDTNAAKTQTVKVYFFNA